jgi:hypothetical protein
MPKKSHVQCRFSEIADSAALPTEPMLLASWHATREISSLWSPGKRCGGILERLRDRRSNIRK